MSLCIVFQIVFGLAVAEEAYMFEHRDLHIGNILIKKCSNKKIAYVLEGEHFDVPSRGIKVHNIFCTNLFGDTKTIPINIIILINKTMRKNS